MKKGKSLDFSGQFLRLTKNLVQQDIPEALDKYVLEVLQGLFATIDPLSALKDVTFLCSVDSMSVVDLGAGGGRNAEPRYRTKQETIAFTIGDMKSLDVTFAFDLDRLNGTITFTEVSSLTIGGLLYYFDEEFYNVQYLAGNDFVDLQIPPERIKEMKAGLEQRFCTRIGKENVPLLGMTFEVNPEPEQYKQYLLPNTLHLDSDPKKVIHKLDWFLSPPPA